MVVIMVVVIMVDTIMAVPVTDAGIIITIVVTPEDNHLLRLDDVAARVLGRPCCGS